MRLSEDRNREVDLDLFAHQVTRMDQEQTVVCGVSLPQ